MVTFAGNEIEDTCAPLFGKVLAVSPFSVYVENQKQHSFVLLKTPSKCLRLSKLYATEEESLSDIQPRQSYACVLSLTGGNDR